MTLPLRRRALLLALACGAAAVGAACSGGGKSAGPTPVPSGTAGGFVSLEYNSVAPSVLAYFFVSSEGFAAPALDGCATPSTTPGPTRTYLDAGATMTVTGGPSPITANGVGDATYFYYAASPPPSDVSPDRNYDVSVPGGPDLPATTWSHAIRVKHAISLPANLPLPSSGGLDLSWTPAGGDYIRFDFYYGYTGSPIVSCFARDDGTFTVPAPYIAGLPSSTGDGFVATTTVETTAVIDGRIVAFDGEAAAYATWTKP